MKKVLIVSPWHWETKTFQGITVSKTFSLDEADALICHHYPTEELPVFPRRKFWYCIEPATTTALWHGDAYRDIVATLSPGETIYHAHPDPHFRVPHFTHHPGVRLQTSTSRQGIVSIIGNSTGGFSGNAKDLAERAQLSLRPEVDLYGPWPAWHRYHRTFWGGRKPPENYKGDPDCAMCSPEKWALLSRYKANICMENTQEPYYFTEKFVDAVIAGCIPIYRAHPQVRERFLQGAMWIDPGDYGGNPNAIIAAAQAADRVAYAEANWRWLKRPEIAVTRSDMTMGRLLAIVDRELGQEAGIQPSITHS